MDLKKSYRKKNENLFRPDFFVFDRIFFKVHLLVKENRLEAASERL